MKIFEKRSFINESKKKISENNPNALTDQKRILLIVEKK